MNPTRSLRRTEPDFEQFRRVLLRRDRPTHLPFYEHIASPGFIARRTGAPVEALTWENPDYPRLFVNFWLDLGFDCIPLEILPYLPLPAGHGGLTEESEARVVIRSRQDYENYPWPSEAAPLPYRHFDEVARWLPDGVKIVGGVCAGPYEWASWMLGTIGMAYLLEDDPDLVAEVFRRIGALHIAAVKELAARPSIGALRQGDDLGFRTSTFLSPAWLRKLVFPIYRQMAAAAHAQGKPFILHSCGNLAQIYDDLIDDCRIDAKHSFEDAILPVEQFKAQYGHRVTPLGGLDVDVICRGTPEAIRPYTRRKIEACFADGFWALGTGNSLTDYMPVENYLIVLEEGLRAGTER
jgi:uroporphyrinogen decarboxylase